MAYSYSNQIIISYSKLLSDIAAVRSHCSGGRSAAECQEKARATIAATEALRWLCPDVGE